MYKAEKINRRIMFVLLSITVSILITACAAMKESTSNGQLIIREQGSFAAGGYYGDYIPNEPTQNPGQEQWRAALAMAKSWRNVVNKHGGDVTLIHLPEIGIKGNSHFPMSDLNNVQIADLMSKFLKEKGLD